MLFDKIVYINLLRRPDRNQHIVNSLKYLGLLDMSERSDAVDGKQLDENSISRFLVSSEGISDAFNSEMRVYEPLTKGGIGCALSHRNIYRKIIDENINRCLILEDDVKFDINFFSKMKLIENKIPQDFDILFLGYHFSNISKDINKYYFVPSKTYGLFGYVVSKEGAKKLLDLFPITYQIDTEISNNMNKFKVYCVDPEYHILYSDRSSTTSQFGTDIQIRENFGSMTYNIIILVILVFIITLFVLFGLQYYFNKN